MLLEMLDTLDQAARRFQTVADFISFVDKVIESNRRMEELKKIPNYNAVHLMTVHASKGLESKEVFLIGAVDGVMPHRSTFKAGEQNGGISAKDKKEIVQDALEEENRIFYVGVLKVEDGLYSSSPRNYQGKETEVSLFLIHAFREAQ
jgi:DNA helicase-2/ATP-dependent DNA helicase PcrA